MHLLNHLLRSPDSCMTLPQDRARDVLPLPLLSEQDLCSALVNSAIIGINALYGFPSASCGRRPIAAQRSVIEGFRTKTSNFMNAVTSGDILDNGHTALEKLGIDVASKPKAASDDLVADNFDR